MNRFNLLLLTVLLLPLGVQAEVNDDDVDESDGDKPAAVRQIALNEVPPAALGAARREKPDVYFDSAERIIWKDDPVYQINGAKGRDIWRVYVTVQGNVLRVERDTREGRGDD